MLAIAGGKGGCGKTTATLGLARALARSGSDPIVVDADLDMPDVHVVASVDREPNTDDVAAGAPVETVCHYTPDLSGVGIVPAGQVDSLGTALDELSTRHGPVLVDCPAGAGRDAIVPLRYCDGSVLVTTPTPQAVEDTVKTAAIARQLDAPPRVALARGSRTRSLGRSLDCPVQRAPDVDASEIHSHPRFQAACQTVVNIAFEGML